LTEEDKDEKTETELTLWTLSKSLKGFTVLDIKGQKHGVDPLDGKQH
jgi:hypothetical protein